MSDYKKNTDISLIPIYSSPSHLSYYTAVTVNSPTIIPVIFDQGFLVYITKKNFDTHTWAVNMNVCKKCGIYYSDYNGILRADKDISCAENKLSNILK